MNKQEAIEEINNLKGLTILDKTINFDDEMVSKKEVLNIVKQLDEPEKPVVPQFVADWIEDHKGDYNKWDEEARAEFVFRAINDLFRFGDDLNTWEFTIFEEFSDWTTENAYEFITAILFGYGVKKEKLYTAKLKLTNEYLGYESRFEDLLHYKVPEKSAKEEKTYHFTEDDLVKYRIWGNENYEVKEAEE